MGETVTQRRNDPDSIRNHFDRIAEGIGHRGSSFSDLDAISHDGRTHRFLVQEFKRPNEMMSAAQRALLTDLAKEPRFTVWFLMKMNEGEIVWSDFLSLSPEIITAEQYRERLREWWDNSYDVAKYVHFDDEVLIRKA